MATVTKFPQTFGGTYDSLSNASADDGAYANIRGWPNVTNSVIASNFDFQIPSGATINSITINCEEKCDVWGYMYGYFSTKKNQSTVGSDLNWGLITGSYGDTTRTKTANGEWTADELNLNDLSGMSVVVSSDGFLFGNGYWHYVDYISVTIDYTPPIVTASGSFAQII